MKKLMRIKKKTQELRVALDELHGLVCETLDDDTISLMGMSDEIIDAGWHLDNAYKCVLPAFREYNESRRQL